MDRHTLKYIQYAVFDIFISSFLFGLTERLLSSYKDRVFDAVELSLIVIVLLLFTSIFWLNPRLK